MQISLTKLPDDILDIEEVMDEEDDLIEDSETMSDEIKGLLFRAVGLWLISDDMDTQFNGTKEEVDALSKVMVATKDFFTYLRNQKDTDFKVMQSLLNRKLDATKVFTDVFGFNWPF
jgi:hypothetical protein